MNENRLSIIINRPTSDVFRFALDPKNTAKWIEDIEVEETNEWPVKIGTIYRNKSRTGVWRQYKLVELVENRTFVLRSNEDANFSVRYTFYELPDNSTEFEYYEWTEHSEITDPFTMDGLETLKTILEAH